MTDKAFQYIY